VGWKEAGDRRAEEAGVDAEIREQLAFEERRELARTLILQVRIELRAADTAVRTIELTLFAVLPDAVVVQITPGGLAGCAHRRPRVPTPPVRRIRIDVGIDRGRARIPPVRRVVGLQTRLAVATQIVGEADSRRREVPRDQIVDGGERDLRCVERADRRTDLLRQVRAVAIEDRAERERQPRADTPAV